MRRRILPRSLLRGQVAPEVSGPAGLGWKDSPRTKSPPKDFRQDVVRVVRSREAGVTIPQAVKEFGIHPRSTRNRRRSSASMTAIGEGRRRGNPPSYENCVSATGCWSKRLEFCAARPRTGRRRIGQEYEVPAWSKSSPRTRSPSHHGAASGPQARPPIELSPAEKPCHRARTHGAVPGQRAL